MTLFRRVRASAAKTITIAVTATGLTGCALLGSAAPASASHNQVSLFEEPSIEQLNPPNSPTYIQEQLQALRNLGVGVIRLDLTWDTIAPDPKSRARPSFNASDPNAYPASNWALYDELINTAQSYGMQVDAIIGGPAPLWATQQGAPGCGQVGGSPICFDNVWYPSASEYGQFARAVASRYSSVHFWEIWDEANWGPALAPQFLNGTLVAANMYRGLLNAGYGSLQSTGHGRDTIVAGNYSQYASAKLNATATTPPITFTRDLYCVNSSYQPLRGGAARALGCPTTRAATRRFRGNNPGLFKISSFGVHPYQVFNPPTKPDFPSPTAVEYAEIPHFATTLDRTQGAYGSRKRMSIYNTEYGYQTRPPAGPPNPTPDTAAIWLNQAEYIAWKNPRIASYEQYELQDASWFKTGLLNADRTPKATYYAYRMPIWLPSSSQRKRKSLEVWGAVRPAHFASGSQRTAWIQFAPGSSGQFRNLKSVQIRNATGYFDVHVKFPSRGQVRIAWQYPPGTSLYNGLSIGQPWIYSRVVGVSVH